MNARVLVLAAIPWPTLHLAQWVGFNLPLWLGIPLIGSATFTFFLLLARWAFRS